MVGAAFVAALAVLAYRRAKCVTAQLSGGWAFVGALAPGLVVHTALVLALLFALAQ